jgi:hypothetical protein
MAAAPSDKVDEFGAVTVPPLDLNAGLIDLNFSSLS